MAYTRDLTEEERRFCETLGGVVIFWNHVENQMRGLLHFAVGAMTHRTNVLIANLGNVSLAEAVNAIAEDHEALLGDHMRHASKLFDALRIYRNHFVHSVVTFHTMGQTSKAYAKQISARGGALKLHESFISTESLIDLHDRLSGLQAYLGAITDDLKQVPPRESSPLLESRLCLIS